MRGEVSEQPFTLVPPTASHIPSNGETISCNESAPVCVYACVLYVCSVAVVQSNEACEKNAGWRYVLDKLPHKYFKQLHNLDTTFQDNLLNLFV